MRKVLAACFILILLLLSIVLWKKYSGGLYLQPAPGSLSISNQTESTKADWKPYKNQAVGLSLLYPAGFTIFENKDGGDINRIVFSDKVTQISVEDYVAPSPDRYRVLKQEHVTVGEEEGTMVYYAANNFTDNVVTHVAVTIHHNTSGFTFWLTNESLNKQMTDDQIARFKKVLASVQFTKE